MRHVGRTKTSSMKDTLKRKLRGEKEKTAALRFLSYGLSLCCIILAVCTAAAVELSYFHRSPLHEWVVGALQTAKERKKERKRRKFYTGLSNCWRVAYLHFKRRKTQDVLQGNAVDHYGHLRGGGLVWAHVELNVLHFELWRPAAITPSSEYKLSSHVGGKIKRKNIDIYVCGSGCRVWRITKSGEYT